MSVHVMSWVLRESEARLADRLVLLALADHAKADGTCAWPSVDTIRHEARLKSRRATQNALRSLESDGRIIVAGKSRAGTVIYNVLMTEAAALGGGGAKNAPAQNMRSAESDDEGAHYPTKDVSKKAPEPSVAKATDPSREPSGGEGGLIDIEFETLFWPKNTVKWPHPEFAGYPRREGKGQARRAYRTARKLVDADTIMEGVAASAADWRSSGRSMDKIPHAATWLNGERWTDELGAVAASSPDAAAVSSLMPAPESTPEERNAA